MPPRMPIRTSRRRSSLGGAPAEHARREPQDRRQQRKVEHDRAGLLARGQAADLDRRARRAEGPDEREERPGRRSSDIGRAPETAPRWGDSMISTPAKPTITAVHR